MEVPATLKVKVNDFFQRLVRGLLIYYSQFWVLSVCVYFWVYICFCHHH